MALVGNYLRGVHPTLYSVLVLLEIVEDPYEHNPEPPVLNNGQLVRATYRAYKLHFNQLGALLNDPASYIKACYYPNGLPTRAAANALADELFPRLARLFDSVGLLASYGMSVTDGQNSPNGLTYGAASDGIQRHMLTVLLRQGQVTELGFTLALSSQQDGNLGLIIAPFGTAAYFANFTHWLVSLLLSASIDGLAIGPQGVLLGRTGALPSFTAMASAVSQPDNSDKAFLFGAPDGTYLSIGEVAFSANIQASTSTGADYGVLGREDK